MVRAQWEMEGQRGPQRPGEQTCARTRSVDFSPGWGHTEGHGHSGKGDQLGNALWSDREDTVGTDARVAEEEPTTGMRSQGSRRKWSLRHGFSVREERSYQTVRGGGETRALDLQRRKSVENEARTDEVEGWE